MHSPKERENMVRIQIDVTLTKSVSLLLNVRKLLKACLQIPPLEFLTDLRWPDNPFFTDIRSGVRCGGENMHFLWPSAGDPTNVFRQMDDGRWKITVNVKTIDNLQSFKNFLGWLETYIDHSVEGTIRYSPLSSRHRQSSHSWVTKKAEESDYLDYAEIPFGEIDRRRLSPAAVSGVAA